MWVRLGDIGQIIGGGTPKTEVLEYWNGDIPWLTPADMKNIKNKFVSSGSRKITELGLQKSSAQLLLPGSIVYSSRAPIGYLAITKEKLCTNQGFRSISPYGLIDIEYLYYILQSRFSDIISRASGTTFLEISGIKFGKTLIPLAPLNEQQRIVNKVDELMKLSHQFEHIINQAV